MTSTMAGVMITNSSDSPPAPRSGRSRSSRQRRRSRWTEPVLQWRKWSAFGDPIHKMEGSALGNAILGEWLREVRHAVETEGTLTEGAVQKLAGHFDGKPNSLVHELEAFRLKLEGDPDGLDAALRERQKAETLAFLDRQIGGFQIWQQRCVDEEEHEEEARQAAAVLPSGEVLDKILRYETKLERQMYRAMAQLERVQRMRGGEAIPAPLSVEVSDRG